MSYLCLCNEKSMDNFAAIDFETANNERTSICSVGVVIGKWWDSRPVLQPRSSWTGLLFVLEHRIHGLTQEDTAHAPVFSEVWKQVAPKIEGFRWLHNKTFDEDVWNCVPYLCMDYLIMTFIVPIRLPGSWKVEKPPVTYGGRFLVLNWRITKCAVADAEACHGLPDRFCEL